MVKAGSIVLGCVLEIIDCCQYLTNTVEKYDTNPISIGRF